ncbi:hypothetical protein [Rhodococcus koreensis]
MSTVTETRDIPQRGVPLMRRTPSGATNTALTHDLQTGFRRTFTVFDSHMTGALFTACVHGGAIGPRTAAPVLCRALFGTLVRPLSRGVHRVLYGAL